MPTPNEPLRQADLPEMEKSFWQLTGPGAIMVGLAVGSGELILWPWIVARFGASMAWAPIVATIFQVWITMEVGRWAIATGESAMQGMARAWLRLMHFFLACLFVLTMLPGWGRALAATLRFTIFGTDGPGAADSFLRSDWFWSLPVTVVVWLVLLGPRRIYDGLEKVVTVLVLIIFVGVVVVAIKIGTWADVQEMTWGVIGFPPRIVLDEDFSFLRFFGATVFAGAGGFGLLFYAYYLRDKGIGMGQRFPMLTIDIRGTSQRASEVGYIFSDSPENRRRFRDWFRYVLFDTSFLFGLISCITVFLFMFASLIALHPQERGFAEGPTLVWALSDILGAAMGTWGRYLFLGVAMAALFSTILANADGGMRLWTDCLHTGVPATRKWTPGQMYVPLLLITWVISFASLWYFETHEVTILDFFFVSAAINGIAMSIFSPVVLFLNFKYLPKFARPGPVHSFFVIGGTLMYASFSVYLIWTYVARWLGF